MKTGYNRCLFLIWFDGARILAVYSLYRGFYRVLLGFQEFGYFPNLREFEVFQIFSNSGFQGFTEFSRFPGFTGFPEFSGIHGLGFLLIC